MTRDPHNRSRGLPGSPGLNATADDLAREAQAQAREQAPLPRPVSHAIATDRLIIAALIIAAIANITSIVWR